MTIRSFASTIAANGSWIGFAVLFPIGAALMAAAFWAEIAQLLFGLADLSCAACVDPSQGIDTAAAAAGTAGAGAAAAGAAAGPGQTEGVGESNRDDNSIRHPDFRRGESWPDEATRDA